MNIAVLNVEGPTPAVEALTRLLKVRSSAISKKGDPRRNGAVFASDGFQLDLADAESPRDLLETVRAFVAKCKHDGVSFALPGVTAELSIGFTVGESRQYAAGVDFSTSEMSAMAECGISLSVMAYPTSDEANADDGT